MSMAKNIVICADGTGNTTIKGRGTNVFKIYEAVDQNGHRNDPTLTPQIGIYHDGVGTESFRWLRLFTGATGFGLSRNVRDLYAALGRIYEPNDQIYLFGFSRGAFTVRTLAGLILTCGILDANAYDTNEEFEQAVGHAYARYRESYQAHLADALAAIAGSLYRRPDMPLRRTVLPEKATIRFIGVWDTVDAVGLPFRIADFINTHVYAFKFRTTTLDKRVLCARQALALDEERKCFVPVLWDEQGDDSWRIQQVWFAGVHSNVGGGYPRQGMSLVALEWMMKEAFSCGLRFNDGEREHYYTHRDVNDKMYDPRSGAGILYRWQPRNVEALCRAARVETILVHRSAFERIARNTEGYVPGSIPRAFKVVSSSLDEADCERIEATVSAAYGGSPSLPELSRIDLRRGQLSYRSFVAAIGLLAVVGIGLCIVTWAGYADAARLLQHPLITVAGAVLLAASYVLHLWTDHTLDRTHSRFWHKVREPLRVALGIHRAEVTDLTRVA
jgi:uncharacterized protein (DUF2235 family)